MTRPTDLDEFLTSARSNEQATAANLPDFVEHLRRVERLLSDCCDNLHHPHQGITIPIFMVRAYSAYLAAVRLAMSGQAPEVQPLLRSCLENALYGNLIYQDNRHREMEELLEPSLEEIWLRRDDSAETLERMRAAFTAGAVKRALVKADRTMGARIGHLYDEMITAGAHPNPEGLAASMTARETESGVEYIPDILVGDSIPLRYALITCASVGIAVVEVYRIIFPRFDLLSYVSRLEELKREHDRLRLAQKDILSKLSRNL